MSFLLRLPNLPQGEQSINQSITFENALMRICLKEGESYLGPACTVSRTPFCLRVLSLCSSQTCHPQTKVPS